MLTRHFLAISNVNQLQGYGELTGKEYAQALVEGLNQGSGVDAPGLGTGFDLPGERFDFKGFDAFKVLAEPNIILMKKET